MGTNSNQNVNEFYFIDCTRYRDQQWLKAREMTEGKVYIAKDGRLLLYLGLLTDSSVLFYRICNIAFKSIDVSGVHCLSLANYPIQTPNVINMCKATLESAPSPESFQRLKHIPDLYSEFSLVDYTQVYMTWYNKARTLIPSIPELAKASGKLPNSNFVKSKDLVVGHIYYSGSSWRSTYIYMGRSSEGEYVWHFIGNADYIYSEGMNYILKNLETTKSNKKIKDIANIKSDVDAYITDETYLILGHSSRVNTSGLTQEVLDYWLNHQSSSRNYW